jgi:tetratricopeptide (TPR) repeat protein
MSTDKAKAAETKGKAAAVSSPPPRNKPPAPPAAPETPLFRRTDWISAAITALLVFVGYYLTLSPNLTLEDSGELATGSFYAGVPHPPGYPFWTLYTWLFTVLLPVSNIAWRVSVSSAVAGGIACGLLARAVSRGCSMLIEGIPDFKDIERRWENWLCLVSGFVAGMLLGFNGFMWSQGVIVEVYTLSVVSLMAVIISLMLWFHKPEKRKYIYWAMFWFGVCFTNHQTLICAAMGIEIAIVARKPSLGRDLLFFNSIIFIGGLLLMFNGSLESIQKNPALYNIYLLVGISSIVGCGWFWLTTREILSEWKTSLIMGVLFALGAGFYLYMPLASTSNPPMNWGYARTREGFMHALTRGQYEATHPTSAWGRFFEQLGMLLDGAIDEFNLVYLVVGLLPFFFYRRMEKRERAWLVGVTAIYLFLSILLLILLNPSPDRQSRELNKVFFTASHVMLAMLIGYGLTLIGSLALTHYERFRTIMLGLGAVAAGVSLYYVVKKYEETEYWIVRYAAIVGLGITVLFTAAILIARQRAPIRVILALFAAIPAQSVLSHWSDNEQRGHMFGYWFGHDMFTPPFGVYPEMTRNAVLFGGTDPGRFCPTYMIFCESFIPPRCKMDTDPKFDRRDVYIITQNALADATYLMYIRAHYNRSTQKDPPFFQEFLRPSKEREFNTSTNILARTANTLLDRPLTALGDAIEKRRRSDGVYPPKEIHTPTMEDSQKAFEDYVQDAQRRLQANQLKPGEDVKVQNNKIQVSGQVAVMAINGLLTKTIFDKNPEHEFFVEESFPLDWMFPYLTPFGIIMKINREPIAEMTEEMVRKDHDFWSKYSSRFIGNWITYDTPISNICDFAETVFNRHDTSGFKGDPKFVRDNDAQKAFSKLRSAIGGLYTWRINATIGRDAEQKRMIREADFAFKQAFAFCPYSPEAVFRYTNLLLSLQRVDDAIRIAQTFIRLDPQNSSAQSLLDQLNQFKGQQVAASQMRTQFEQLEHQFAATSNSPQAGFQLYGAYMQLQQTGRAVTVLDRLAANPNAEAATLVNLAGAYAQVSQPVQRSAAISRAVQLAEGILTNPVSDPGALTVAAQAFSLASNIQKMEQAIMRLTAAAPTSPEAWYDLASIQAAMNKGPEAVKSLGRSLQLSNQRLIQQPSANNLQTMAAQDSRFNNLRALPEFQALFAPKQ